MSFMRGDLLTRVGQLVKGGVMKAPRWLNAVKTIPPHPKKSRNPKAPRIRFPEDPFVASFYDRHPEEKLKGYSLIDYDPPPARLYAWRCMELLEANKGMTRRQVRGVVEAEMEEQRLEEERAIQLERETALREGREPPEIPKTELEEFMEEEWEAMKRGLEHMGAEKVRKNVERLEGGGSS